MLILKRKIGESIIINNNTEIQFLDYKAGQFLVGIKAPKNVKIDRGEILADISSSKKPTTEEKS